MAIRIEFDPEGVRAIANAIDAGALEGLDAAGDIIVADARERAPQATGQLVNSIQVTEQPTGSVLSGGATMTIGAGAPYATFVEFGTGIHGPKGTRIYPKTKKAMRWEGAGGYIFARSTAGMKAQPFMVPAVEENLDTIGEVVGDAIDNALDKVGR